MKKYKKIISFLLQTPFWLMVGAYMLTMVIYVATTFPYIKGFIEWVSESFCDDVRMPLPRIPIIPSACVFLYASFQIKKKDIIYATLLLIGALLPFTAVLLFLPYQAYLMRHKNKMMAVLCLALCAVLVYFKIWQIDLPFL